MVGISSRILLIAFILVALAMSITHGSASVSQKALGVKTQSKEYSDVYRKELEAEIKKAQDVLALRPDYAGAWMRLAVLYDQLGDSIRANDAREMARKLNPE